MTDSEWLHYRDLKSRCPACKRPAHIAKRDETFYFVDDEYNPFVRHAPVKTTEAVFRFFANGYRREHGTEPEVTGNRKLSERDILSGMRQMLYDLSKREKARYRKWAETVAFFATDCSFLDIANLVDRSVAQVVHEIHDTWYEDYMLGCIDYIASVAYHGGILLKPITTEKEITGHIGDTILSWCEKGQKDDGGNEFRD